VSDKGVVTSENGSGTTNKEDTKDNDSKESENIVENNEADSTNQDSKSTNTSKENVSGEDSTTNDDTATSDDKTANEDTTSDEDSTENEEDTLLVTDQVVIDGMTEDILNNMSLEEKIGQLFIVSMESLDDSKGDYYEWRKVTNEMKKTLKNYSVGGVVFFSRNIDTKNQTAQMISELNNSSRVPLFMAVNEEGGDSGQVSANSNMGIWQFPNMNIVGELKDKEYAKTIGKTIGEQLNDLGFNLDFAPVADVITNEDNVKIGKRSFGNDAELVSEMVAEVVKGLQSQNVSATLKHFPGEGDISKDTNNGSVNIDNNLDRLRDIDFLPFKAGIKAGADLILVSHASISRVTENTIPASLSSLVMHNILRTELGFEGVIITDALNMKAITEEYTSSEAAVKAIKAGADLLLMPEDLESAYKSIIKAVEKGTIKESRIDSSVRRILKIKIKRGIILSDTNLIEKEIIE
jgi:beta-N-acetylhexosaminidase